MRSGKILLGSLVICNSIFLFLFLWFSYFNRIAIDDLYFLGILRDHGIIGSTKLVHATWTGRWASVPLIQSVLTFHDHRYFLLVYGIAVLALFVWVIYRIVGPLTSAINWPELNRWHRSHVAIFIVSAFFYCTIGIAETWFWLCSSATYLVSLVMLLLGVSTIISRRKGMAEMLLCIVVFSYVGGSCEPLALFVIMVLVIAVLYGGKKRDFPIRKVSLALVICSFAFALLYAGHGNRVREGFFENITIWQALVLNVKTTGMIVLLKLPGILPAVILFSLPAVAIARYLVRDRLSANTVIKRIVRILIAFFVALFMYQLPITYVTQDIGADRALFAITLFALVAAILVAYTLGSSTTAASLRIDSMLPLGCILVVIGINLFMLHAGSVVVPRYANAYDQRMKLLQSLKNEPELILVDPLPPSGLLYSAEISTDPGYFANQHLRSGLGLKGDVARRSEVSR